MKSKYIILSLLGVTFMGFWMIGGSLLNSGISPIGLIGVPLFIAQSFQDQGRGEDINYPTEQSLEVKVTGTTALRICDALEIACSSESEFDGIYWPTKNITTVTYSKDGVENYFSIDDEEICQQLEDAKSCVPKITLTEKFTDSSINGNLITLTIIPDQPGIEENVDYVPLSCPDGQIDRDGECVINTNCKPPFFITIDGICVTDKSSPECYPNFLDDQCRVSVECAVPYESSITIPQCMPTSCPNGFLHSMVPVGGGDAICERIERNIEFTIFRTFDNKILRDDAVDALDITATIPDETEGNLRIIILVSGWYEQLGNPNITLINPRNVEVENPFTIFIKDSPGFTIFGYDTTIMPTDETGIWKVHVSLTGFDDLPTQSFQVINSNDMITE